jgi:hypothetical protein
LGLRPCSSENVFKPAFYRLSHAVILAGSDRFDPHTLHTLVTSRTAGFTPLSVPESQEVSQMANLTKFYVAPIVAAALLTSAAYAQDTQPAPPTAPPVEPANGALLGGELAPGAIAAGALVAVGIAIAVSGDDDAPSTTTTTTTTN